jgi:glycosyltransferase involved in cell wall biosynthesis
VTRGPAPVLSVIIPVWNRAQYLGEAITSVLEQDGLPDTEVIVIDDGSTDGSADVAERFAPAVRCQRIRHGGLAAARNTGVEAARGNLLLHLDSDDVLPARSIATRMAVFHSHPGTDLVVGQMLCFISPELVRQDATCYRLPSGPQRGGLPGASIVRAGFAARVGRFDTARNNSPDLDWMTRATEHDPRVVNVSSVVLHRRIHGGNMSLARDGSASDRLATLRAALARRRMTDGG